MSTKAVPGVVKANADELAMGGWAEHEDGSLIFVESVENGSVVFVMFDLGAEPVQYRHAMPQSDFEKNFTYDPNKRRTAKNEEWTWHDKTPFDWNRVMQEFPDGQGSPSAVATITAAARVAKSLDARATKIDAQNADTGRSMMTKLRDMINEVLEPDDDEN